MLTPERLWCSSCSKVALACNCDEDNLDEITLDFLQITASIISPCTSTAYPVTVAPMHLKTFQTSGKSLPIGKVTKTCALSKSLLEVFLNDAVKVTLAINNPEGPSTFILIANVEQAMLAPSPVETFIFFV